jgi:hypothetical protein
MSSFSNIQALLREKYNDHKEIIFDSEDVSPVLACFEANSDDDGEGRGFIFPITSNGQRVASGTFATSQTKARALTSGSQATHNRWVITPAEISGFAEWDRRELNAVKDAGPEKAFDVIDKRYKDAMNDIRHQLSICAVEAGWGKIGQGTAVSSTTITLPASIVNRVDVGDTLVPSATESGGVLLATAGSTVVTAINYDTGVVTVDTDTTTGGTPATATSFWFRTGNRDNAATPARLLPVGLGGWLDTAVLFGVTRSGNPRLTGHSVSASGLDTATGLKRLATRLFKAGCPAPDTCFLSAEDHEILSLDKDVQKNVDIALGPYEIGFKAVGLYGPNGKFINCVADANLIQGTAFMGPFNTKEWRPQLKYSKEVIAIDNFDGNDMLRLDASAAYEMRLFSNVAMAIPAVGYYGKATSLPSS